jgi:hypothetical protein
MVQLIRHSGSGVITSSQPIPSEKVPTIQINSMWEHTNESNGQAPVIMKGPRSWMRYEAF